MSYLHLTKNRSYIGPSQLFSIKDEADNVQLMRAKRDHAAFQMLKQCLECNGSWCHNYLANTYQCKQNRVYISINTSSMSKNTNNINNDKIYPKLKITRTTSKKSMNVMPRKIMPSCGIGSSTLSMNVNNNGQIMGKKKETVYQVRAILNIINITCRV